MVTYHNTKLFQHSDVSCNTLFKVRIFVKHFSWSIKKKRLSTVQILIFRELQTKTSQCRKWRETKPARMYRPIIFDRSSPVLYSSMQQSHASHFPTTLTGGWFYHVSSISQSRILEIIFNCALTPFSSRPHFRLDSSSSSISPKMSRAIDVERQSQSQS